MASIQLPRLLAHLGRPQFSVGWRALNLQCATRILPSRLKSTTVVDPGLYDEAFRRSIEEPEEFWAEAAQNVEWHKKWDKVLDNSKPPFSKWFVGGELNVCHNAVDRHVEAGFGDQIAIIHDSPVTNSITKMTYGELLDKVSRFAGVLRTHGVQHGDRVLIYMPMIPEAMIAMLASARIGAIHSLVFGGFASKELATRINHAQPKVIVSANCGVEPGRTVEYKPLLDNAIDLSTYKPQTVVIYNRECDAFNPAALTSGRDCCWKEELAIARPVDCVPVSAMHPLYLLYTSGTTGTPKAVVRPSGGHAVALHWSMWNIYGIKPHETWFTASDLGWVVGHSYINYAPLLHCNTTVLYEGKPIGTPDPGSYFRVLQDHKVAGMFTAPTAVRAIRREDPDGKYAAKYCFDEFRYLFLAGEHCDHETLDWLRDTLQRPVLDNWWQTETGHPITSTCVGLGNDLYPPAGMAGKPVPGWNVQMKNKAGSSDTEDEELGTIVIKLPLPPGSFSTLWMDDKRYADLYFSTYPGYYDSMDAGFVDELGNIAVMSRADDVINVAGHRLSTGQLEEAVLEHNDIAEAAVIGVPDKLKGQVPLGLCVLKTGVSTPENQLLKEVVEKVREHIGPVAAFKSAILVQKLPKTRSGKVARNTIAAMAAGKPFKIPVTIEDPAVYADLEAALQKAGYKPGHPSQ